MSNEDNIIEFPQDTQEVASIGEVGAVYHYSAFRTGRDGSNVWFDGVANLDAAILTHEQYGNMKKLIASHYDVPETNIVIVSLVRLDTFAFDLPPANDMKVAV